MDYRVGIRALAIALAAVNAGLAILLTQGGRVLTEGQMLWVAVASAAVGAILAALPSAAGVSSVRPIQEEELLRREHRRGVLSALRRDPTLRGVLPTEGEGDAPTTG